MISRKEFIAKYTRSGLYPQITFLQRRKARISPAQGARERRVTHPAGLHLISRIFFTSRTPANSHQQRFPLATGCSRSSCSCSEVGRVARSRSSRTRARRALPRSTADPATEGPRQPSTEHLVAGWQKIREIVLKGFFSVVVSPESPTTIIFHDGSWFEILIPTNVILENVMNWTTENLHILMTRTVLINVYYNLAFFYKYTLNKICFCSKILVKHGFNTYCAQVIEHIKSNMLFRTFSRRNLE